MGRGLVALFLVCCGGSLSEAWSFFSLRLRKKPLKEMNESVKPFLGKKVRVAVLQRLPWLRLNFSGDTFNMDEVQMSGPMANLLDLLTENLGFTYTLHSPEDGHWGVPLPNGNWTGLVGMMHNNISDLALGPLVMTYGRSLVTTFSSQVTTDYLTILAGFPNIIHASIFGTLMAFELQVWLALLASLVFCFSAAVMFDLSSQRKMGTPIKDILLANWWMYFSVLFNEAAPRTPRGTPSRVVFAMWWLTVVVLMNAFTGHMKATMMVRREPDRIDSMKDLAKHNHMKTFVWKGSAYESLLKNSLNIPEYQAVWRMVVRCNGTIETKSLYSKANLIEVQQGVAAIVGDATTMRFHVATNCGVLRHGTFYFSKEQFFPHKYAVALNRYEDPAFVAAINQRISWTVESGLLDGWMEEQYGDWRKCSAGSEEVYQPLSLFEAQSIFVIYLMFSAAAAVAFLGELLVGGLPVLKNKSTVRIIVTPESDGWKAARRVIHHEHSKKLQVLWSQGHEPLQLVRLREQRMNYQRMSYHDATSLT